jgi:hypothetical protein
MLTQGDKDRDRELTKEEFTALAGTWFGKLDPDMTGQLSLEQLTSRLGNILPVSSGPKEAAGNDPVAGRGQGPDGSAVISPDVLGPILFVATD